MFVVFSVTGSLDNLTALLIRNGWQNFSAMRHARGVTTAKSGHLSVPSATRSNEFGPFFVTKRLESQLEAG